MSLHTQTKPIVLHHAMARIVEVTPEKISVLIRGWSTTEQVTIPMESLPEEIRASLRSSTPPIRLYVRTNLIASQAKDLRFIGWSLT